MIYLVLQRTLFWTIALSLSLYGEYLVAGSVFDKIASIFKSPSTATSSTLAIATDSLPRAISYSTPISVVGGVPPYQCDAQGLPGGIQLNNCTLTGAAKQNGTYNVTLSVKDHVGATATRTVTLTVASLLRITGPQTIPNGTVGQAWGPVVCTATGGSGSYSWTAAGLAPGLVMSSGGMISGTPTQAGMYNVIVMVSDGTVVTGMRFASVLGQ
jgi:large repetitive protein